jgi:hypothetical protein
MYEPEILYNVVMKPCCDVATGMPHCCVTLSIKLFEENARTESRNALALVR